VAGDAAEAFRGAMQRRASTVHLVTYRAPDGGIEGMTATSVTSLSLNPPSLLVCIGHGARARDAIRERGSFGVSVLEASQVDIASTAGQAGGNKAFGAAVTTETDPSVTPVLADALATFHCRVLEARDFFTHTVFVAEVTHTRGGKAGTPLLHHGGGYATVTALPPRPR
jgi:flavin reductase (DIM6/NTAB) family NADH-FMN oxidoreductase RutF